MNPLTNNTSIVLRELDSPIKSGNDTIQEPSTLTNDIYSGLKDWQRDVLAARILVVHTIDAHLRQTGCSLNKAIKAFLRDALNGGPPHLKRAAEVANNRKGNARLLSWQTIYRWFQIREAEGNAGLIPADPETLQDDIPLWVPAFLELYRQPSKPTIADALRQMGEDAPPYHKVHRFLRRFSTLDLQRGRMTGSALRAHSAYTKRDFSELLPMDIIVADGHSYKAYIAHPVHGKRFLPEVEAIIDVATRCCIGWSTGLSESGQVVADALRHAVTVSDTKPMGGLPALFYADNGAGNRAKMNSDEVTGIVARIGCDMKFGLAGNPQGRGIIERLNQSLWIPSAKKLITYNGKDMDALAQRRRLKIIDKDLKEHGSSRYLISFPQFIEFLAQEVDAYNNRPHHSLPKVDGRNMTPIERWQSFIAEGWQPDTLTSEEMRDLFRPQVECITRRGLVTVFNNEYFNDELEHHHGEKVFVNYDIHDPNIVWVRNQKQQLICEAVWGGNRRAYFPLSVVEQAREKRKNRRLALKYEQIREIEAEARGVVDVEERIPEECVMISEKSPLIPLYQRGETTHPCTPPDITPPSPSLNLRGGREGLRGELNDSPLEKGTTPFNSPLTKGDKGGCDTIIAQDIVIASPSTVIPSEARNLAGQLRAGSEKQSRPFFTDEIARYEWHLKNGFHTEDDLKFKISFEQTDSYRMLKSFWQ